MIVDDVGDVEEMNKNKIVTCRSIISTTRVTSTSCHSLFIKVLNHVRTSNFDQRN